MPFFEAIRLAFQTLRTQKLKSAFSLIGVFIGVMFLIAVVSIVQGMNRYMTDKFAGTLLGVNTFRLRQFPDVQLGQTTDSMWRAWTRRPRISYEDAAAVARGITVPVITAWESSTRATLTHGHKQAKDVVVTGATEAYFDVRSLRIAQGRAFTAQEEENGVPVVVLGYELAEKLVEGRDAIGEDVRIFALAFRVIGIVERQGKVAIMMISVTERTREIGVRKALGATKKEILWQFLVEAATLTLVGGAIGMLIGGILSWVLATVTPIPAYVPLWSIVVALAASALTGVDFGLYPANRAARLDPVEALRYE